MRKIGISDVIKYYCNAGKANSMEIKIPMVFSQPADTDKLAQAASEAMTLFPEFAIRPVICSGSLYYEENNKPIKVIVAPDDGSLVVNYGTDEINGHVVFLHVDSADKKRVTLCYFHALSDFVGGMALLKEILYRYGLMTNQTELQTEDTLAAAGIRTSVPDNWQCQENLDPYEHFACKPERTVAETPFVPAFTPGVEIYPQGSDCNHIYDIHLSTAAFLKKTKEEVTTFAPLLTWVLSQACERAFGKGEEPIVVQFPVDLRRIYGCHTVTNFSDGVRFEMDERVRSLPISECSALFMNTMKEQRTREHMDQFLYNMTEQTHAYLNDPDGYIAVNKRLTQPMPEDMPMPVTFGITYPGKLDMPAFLQGMLSHIGIESVINLTKLFCIISTYGDQMTIQSVQRFDGEQMPDAVVAVLADMGIDAYHTDRGVRRQDCFEPSLLKIVEE